MTIYDLLNFLYNLQVWTFLFCNVPYLGGNIDSPICNGSTKDSTKSIVDAKNCYQILQNCATAIANDCTMSPEKYNQAIQSDLDSCKSKHDKIKEKSASETVHMFSQYSFNILCHIYFQPALMREPMEQ